MYRLSFSYRHNSKDYPAWPLHLLCCRVQQEEASRSEQQRTLFAAAILLKRWRRWITTWIWRRDAAMVAICNSLQAKNLTGPHVCTAAAAVYQLYVLSKQWMASASSCEWIKIRLRVVSRGQKKISRIQMHKFALKIKDDGKERGSSFKGFPGIASYQAASSSYSSRSPPPLQPLS